MLWSWNISRSSGSHFPPYLMEHEPIDGQHLKVLRQVIYHQTEQYINSGKVDGRLIVLDPIVKRKDLPRPPSALKQKEPEEKLNITKEYRDKVLRRHHLPSKPRGHQQRAYQCVPTDCIFQQQGGFVDADSITSNSTNQSRRRTLKKKRGALLLHGRQQTSNSTCVQRS